MGRYWISFFGCGGLRGFRRSRMENRRRGWIFLVLGGVVIGLGWGWREVVVGRGLLEVIGRILNLI